MIAKIGKGILWFVKASFVAVCFVAWGWLFVPLAKSIIPAFIDQCVLHQFAEDFLEEKYGMDINVKNERLPLSELNVANFFDYRFSFKMAGEECLFLCYVKEDDKNPYLYGDNGQLNELYKQVELAFECIYAYFAEQGEASKIDTSSLKCYSWCFLVKSHSKEAYSGNFYREEIFIPRYTGDNLHEFPIQLNLYYEDNYKLDKERLEQIYLETTAQLDNYNIVCEEFNVWCGEQAYNVASVKGKIQIQKR
ncbi:MAG: hypothetical protein IJP29_07065 [Lachnospiraceae bacterium]|nr:hypothetical protein [Lachnospiraceae bacterium]